MSEKKAIIFGVTGQDGSHLADLLLEKGYTVVGVGRRVSVNTNERIAHLEGDPKFSIVAGDITDAHSVRHVFKAHEGVDEVYNLAAQSHVAVSFKQPGLTWDITGKGCLNILETMRDLALKARFYQASSSEMFGAAYDYNKDSQFSRHKYQNEDTKFLPQSPYAIAKCAAHYMTRLFREAYHMHASAGILFNHEGPRRGENFVTRKITLWIAGFYRWKRDNQLTENQIRDCNRDDCLYSITDKTVQYPKLRLGNLEAFRDWGYAGDYVEAMWMMLQQDKPDDYVICTGETHTIREFLDVAFLHVGIKDWDRYVIIDPEFYRPAEVDYLRGENAKARLKLKWEPKTTFEQLVRLMVDHDIK
jgi:GDPmannose 4,6-dehydratase